MELNCINSSKQENNEKFFIIRKWLIYYLLTKCTKYKELKGIKFLHSGKISNEVIKFRKQEMGEKVILNGIKGKEVILKVILNGEIL